MAVVVRVQEQFFAFVKVWKWMICPCMNKHRGALELIVNRRANDKFESVFGTFIPITSKRIHISHNYFFLFDLERWKYLMSLLLKISGCAGNNPGKACWCACMVCSDLQETYPSRISCFGFGLQVSSRDDSKFSFRDTFLKILLTDAHCISACRLCVEIIDI